MKKRLLLVLLMVLMAVPALADWSVTVTWTHSVGPNLQNEKVYLDGAEQCTVLGTDPATCNFTVTDLSGQGVSVIAYNSQGTASASYEMGTLLAVPVAPTSGLISITQIP